MILTGKLFKMRYAVANRVQPTLVIHADSMDFADREVLLYAAEQPDYTGEEVRILEATEIALAAL